MMAALINPQPYYPNDKANSVCTHVKLPKNKYKYSLKKKKKEFHILQKPPFEKQPERGEINILSIQKSNT